MADMQDSPTGKKRGRSQRNADETKMSLTPKKKPPAPLANGSILKPSTPQKAAYRSIPLVRNADRSALRKSARKLLDQAGNDRDSDDEAARDDDELAQRIWAMGEDDENNDDDGEEQHEAAGDSKIPETPSKRGRGRPKGSKNRRTPTPPRHLPPYEHYFFQNRPGAIKTSNNTLSSLSLLSHEDYYKVMLDYQDSHEPELEFLNSLHHRSFDQWVFELEEQFNICVYGWGSKRNLLLDFANHLCEVKSSSTIVVVNGFNASITPRDIFHTIASTIASSTALDMQKLGAQPGDMLANILKSLSTRPPESPLTLLVHSIDSTALRRSSTQVLLARLASSPHVNVVASADTPQFPLLWDASIRAQFNWLFHDVTTFRPFDVEIGAGAAGGVVEEVNALLGRSGRKMHGREGVMYVLRSLTENARNLFALLVAELLAAEDEVGGNDVAFDEGANEMMVNDKDDFEAAITGDSQAKIKEAETMTNAGAIRATIPLRTLYGKAVSQLIATSELFFRELLKEFHDHQMVVSKKDMLGTEVLGINFRREEAELVLAELAIAAD